MITIHMITHEYHLALRNWPIPSSKSSKSGLCALVACEPALIAPQEIYRLLGPARLAGSKMCILCAHLAHVDGHLNSDIWQGSPHSSTLIATKPAVCCAIMSSSSCSVVLQVHSASRLLVICHTQAIMSIKVCNSHCLECLWAIVISFDLTLKDAVER